MKMHDIIDTELLHKIPLQPQVQCSTYDQLKALRLIAQRFGLYDAADYLRDVNDLTEARISNSNDLRQSPRPPDDAMTDDAMRGTMTQADRDFMTEHFTAIAERLISKRLWGTNWRVEVDGCVFKMGAKGYPKRGTPIYDEQQAELAQAKAEFGNAEFL